MADAQVLDTNIPQRLDRLPWSRWHLVALGIIWLLDGLKVTLAGSLASVLKQNGALVVSDIQVGASATGYLAGAALQVVAAVTEAILGQRRAKSFELILAPIQSTGD